MHYIYSAYWTWYVAMIFHDQMECGSMIVLELISLIIMEIPLDIMEFSCYVYLLFYFTKAIVVLCYVFAVLIFENCRVNIGRIRA